MGRRPQSNISGVARFLDKIIPFEQASNNSDEQTPERPAKRQRRNNGRQSSSLDPSTAPHSSIPDQGPSEVRNSRYDATGLVPHYTSADQVPADLQKYFSQRRRYFSLYSSGCLLDREGWYSVTPELIANQIAERCRCDVVLDAFCGVGANAIAFAQTCERVIALDNNETRLRLARHNAHIYGVADRIEFILTDYVSFAQSYLSLPQAQRRVIDVVFLSPPWGGPDYLSGSSSAEGINGDGEYQHPEYHLSSTLPLPGDKLWKLSRRITKNVAFYLPRNSCIEEISQLVDDRNQNDRDGEAREMIEIEEEWMGTKLKALTCYFGGLVNGQGHLFQ